jgi:hypothetical protein
LRARPRPSCSTSRLARPWPAGLWGGRGRYKAAGDAIIKGLWQPLQLQCHLQHQQASNHRVTSARRYPSGPMSFTSERHSGLSVAPCSQEPREPNDPVSRTLLPYTSQ